MKFIKKIEHLVNVFKSTSNLVSWWKY